MSKPDDPNAPRKPLTGLRSGPRAKAMLTRVLKANPPKPAAPAGEARGAERGRNERDGAPRRVPEGGPVRGRETPRKPWEPEGAPRREGRPPRPDPRSPQADGPRGEPKPRYERDASAPRPERGPRRDEAPRARPAEERPRAPRPAEDRPRTPRPPRFAGEAGPAHTGAGNSERRERPPRPEGRPAPERAEPRPRRPLPRAHVNPEAGVRVSKLLAERGICSRREADAYIERGWVLVNGVRMAELGARVAPDAEITLAPQARSLQHQQVTILLNKPVGFVSGQPEPGYEPAVTLITAANQYAPDGGLRYKPMHMKGLAPAGRLDIDSTGMLVLTQNGRIARSLIGEDSKVEKEYLVRVEGQLGPDGLALLNHGLELDGKALRPAKVEWLNEDQLRFILREGRKRQIRRMCELVGLHVVGLKRVRIGRVMLSDLPLGMWRYLREDEVF